MDNIIDIVCVIYLPRTEAITSALKRLAEDLGITIFAVEK